MSSQFYLFTFFILFLLASCGGSDDDSKRKEGAVKEVGKSFSEQPWLYSTDDLDAHYKSQVKSKYSGKQDVMSVDFTTVKELLPKLDRSPYYYDFNMDWLPRELSGWTEKEGGYEVDESFKCIYGGRVYLTGTLDEAGEGVVAYNYEQCVLREYTEVNGKGAINIKKVSLPGHDFETNSFSIESQYFDNVVFESETDIIHLTGYKRHQYASEKQGESGADIWVSTEAAYLLFENELTNSEYILDKTTTTRGEIGKYDSEESYVGTLSVDQLGEVGIEGDIGSGSVQRDSFIGAGGSEAKIERLSWDIIKFSIDIDGGSGVDQGVYFGSIQEFYEADPSALDLIDLDLLSLPPRISNTPYFKRSHYSTMDAISVSAGYYEDPDTAHDDLVVSYRWLVNGEYVDGVSGDTLPERTAVYGDSVEVLMIVSDGASSDESRSEKIIIEDSPGSLEVTGFSNVVNVGETISFTAFIDDPDNVNGEVVPAVIRSGPNGMTIDEAGTVTWTPERNASSLFSQQAFKVTFENTNEHEEGYDYWITVMDSQETGTIARSGIEIPSSNYSTVIGNFLGDDKLELLSTDSRQRLFTLSHNDSSYSQSWLYPYALPTEGNIVQLRAANLDEDVMDEMLVATENGISAIYNANESAKILWQTKKYLKAVEVGDLDGNGDLEVAVLQSSSEHGGNRELLVFAFSDFLSPLLEIELTSKANRILFGNTDHDEQLEIVTNDGHVFDGSSLENEWFYGDGFGERQFALGDLDGDGYAEIAGADNREGVSVYSHIDKELIGSLDNFDSCSLVIDNVDADSTSELIVGDCQWGNITAYKLNDSSLSNQWQISMQAHGSKSLVVGDSDNDGDVEVHWGSGGSSSGRDIFVVADVVGSEVELKWKNENPSQLDTFAAAGWSEVNPGEERAVFIVPRTDSRYDGQRLVFLDQTGGYTITDEISSNWEGAMYGRTVDFNKDGNGDIFLATAQIFDDAFSVLQLSDLSTHWTMSDDDASIGVVDYGDFNLDGNDDAVYADRASLRIVDVTNEKIIDVITVADGIKDVAFSKGESHIPMIAIATHGGLSIWKKEGIKFEEQSSADVNCVRAQFANVDDDADFELVCVISDDYGYGSYPESKIILYEIVNQKLEERKRFTIDGKVGDFVVDTTKQNNQDILVGIRFGESYNYDVDSYVQLYSTSDGALRWSSPKLIGEIQHRSMFYRPYAIEHSKPRLMFATSRVMYLVH